MIANGGFERADRCRQETRSKLRAASQPKDGYDDATFGASGTVPKLRFEQAPKATQSGKLF